LPLLVSLKKVSNEPPSDSSVASGFGRPSGKRPCSSRYLGTSCQRVFEVYDGVWRSYSSQAAFPSWIPHCPMWRWAISPLIVRFWWFCKSWGGVGGWSRRWSVTVSVLSIAAPSTIKAREIRFVSPALLRASVATVDATWVVLSSHQRRESGGEQDSMRIQGVEGVKVRQNLPLLVRWTSDAVSNSLQKRSGSSVGCWGSVVVWRCITPGCISPSIVGSEGSTAVRAASTRFSLVKVQYELKHYPCARFVNILQVVTHERT
jgi:hypothetical protein